MEEEIVIIEENNEKEIELEKEPVVYKQSLRAEDVTFDDGMSLQQKFDSGELKGEPGQPGEPGKDGIDGVNGSDYVLTDADKQEIANLVLNELPNSEEVSY